MRVCPHPTGNPFVFPCSRAPFFQHPLLLPTFGPGGKESGAGWSGGGGAFTCDGGRWGHLSTGVLEHSLRGGAPLAAAVRLWAAGGGRPLLYFGSCTEEVKLAGGEVASDSFSLVPYRSSKANCTSDMRRLQVPRSIISNTFTASSQPPEIIFQMRSVFFPIAPHTSLHPHILNAQICQHAIRRHLITLSCLLCFLVSLPPISCSRRAWAELGQPMMHEPAIIHVPHMGSTSRFNEELWFRN